VYAISPDNPALGIAFLSEAELLQRQACDTDGYGLLKADFSPGKWLPRQASPASEIEIECSPLWQIIQMGGRSWPVAEVRQASVYGACCSDGKQGFC
jgi:hypothetical protein